MARCPRCWKRAAEPPEGLCAECRLASKRKALKPLMLNALSYKLHAEQHTFADTRLMAEDLRRALERHRLPADIERAINQWPEAHIDALLERYGPGRRRYVW